MKPEPSELTRRGGRLGAWSSPPWPRRFLKNSSKNSSNGEPGGSCGTACCPPPLPPPRASTFCEVEMLTTASITFSATSAMFSGPRANVDVESAGSAIAAAAIADNAGCRRACARTVNRRAMAVKSPGKAVGSRVHPRRNGRKGPVERPKRTRSRVGQQRLNPWIGAEKRLPRASAPNQPDQHNADDGGRNSHQPQCAVGRLGDMRHRALHRPRQGGEQYSLDGEHQADRDQKVGHSRQPLSCVASRVVISAWLAAPAAGRHLATPAACPTD